MPKNFTGILSDAANPVASKDSYTGDATGLASQLNTVVAAGAELQDQRILQKYSSDITAIESSGAGYAQKMADLNLKMGLASTQNDMKAVTEYSQQIHRLRMGEDSGVLSPTAASIRLQYITKEWATRYPHLTADFKKLYASAGAGGGGAGSDIKLEEDPELKANNQLIYEAGIEGISVGMLLARKRATALAADAKNATEIKAQLGQDAQPDIERFSIQLSNVARNAAWDGLYSELRAGTIDKDQWIISLGRGRDALVAGLRTYITGLEADNGVQFNADWKKSIYAAAAEPLDNVIEAAKQTDSTDKLKRLAEAEMAMRQNRSESVLEKMFPGPLYPIANLTKDPLAFMESVDRILLAQKDKTGMILQTEIAKFDSKTRGLLRFVGTEAFRKMSEENLGGIMTNGEAHEASPEPVFQKATVAQVDQLLMNPNTPPEQAANLAAYKLKNDPASALDNNRVRQLLQTDEGFRSRAERIMTQGIEAAAYNMDPADFDAINFGESDEKTAPMGAKSTSPELAPGEEADQTGGMYSYPAIARKQTAEAQVMADRLNEYYRTKIASGATVEEARTETGRLLVSAINSRTESAQRPTKAQQREAEDKQVFSKEDTNDGLHNAVVTAVQTGKIKPALASRLLRELSSEEDDPAIVEMKDGIFQDSITGAMIEIKNGVLRVVKLN